jgi:iron(III) transport system substrate-binding protein
VIAYNPGRVTPAEVKMLKRYADLTLPQFAGRLGIRTGTNVYPQSHAAMFIVQIGKPATETWLRGLVANAKDKIYPSDMRVVEAVAAGEVDLGLVNNYYVYRGWLDKKWNIPKSKLAYIVPEQDKGQLGKSFNVSGAGVIRASKNKEAAQKFIEFLTERESNERLARDNHEYPVNPASKVHPEMRSMKDFRLAPVSLSDMAGYMVPAIDLIDKVGYR